MQAATEFKDLTAQMLVAVRAGEWDELVVLEQARASLVAAHATESIGLTAEDIELVSAADAEILQRSLARKQEIAQMLGELRVGRRMNQAYRSVSDQS